MAHGLLKTVAVTTAALLCLSFGGCAKEQKEPYVPTRSDAPLVTLATSPVSGQTYSPVYASAFENTIFLATYPVEEWEGEEPECPPRQVSTGGRICCGGEHEGEKPITRVVILDTLVPQSTRDWFRGMATLGVIEGLEKIQTDKVTDMSHMFSGCVLLSSLDAEGWQIPAEVDMTGIFSGCDALSAKPGWYTGE